MLFLSLQSLPGKFMLSYMLSRCRHEYVTVTPEGFRFRQQMFDNLNALFKWFKEHFRDPIPGSTPSTPRGGMTSRTPFPATPSLSMASTYSWWKLKEDYVCNVVTIYLINSNSFLLQFLQTLILLFSEWHRICPPTCCTVCLRLPHRPLTILKLLVFMEQPVYMPIPTR